MKVVIDIECNSLHNPTQIWLIVCKDIDTNALSIFRNVTTDVKERNRFLDFAKMVDLWIGHNFLGYDYPNLNNLIQFNVLDVVSRCVDTLVISKLVDYSRSGGHSIEQYGTEFGLEKIKFSDWTKWSQQMEDYCVRDVEINHLTYNRYRSIIDSLDWRDAIGLEQRFQLVVNDLHANGFGFDADGARSLLARVTKELAGLDEKILKAFPPKEVLIREFVPKATRYGTISKTSVPRSLWGQIHTFEIGKSYRHTRMDDFNPSSHKQLIEVLNEAGWRPEEKTQTHIDATRELQSLKRERGRPVDRTDVEKLSEKIRLLSKSGWKINETNLSTLPSTAPQPARLLAKRILLESRRRTLTEWLSLVRDDGRIHGDFYGIGAWTHRMAHQRPNTANIPREFKEDGTPKLLGKEMRQLWCAPPHRLLVGVDAEGIQLRIFAHYIDDKEFTDALVNGRKADKTDPHSLNKRILGGVCKTRQAAKRFIYALLLGAGLDKLASILDCSKTEAREALDRLLTRYTGFALLKKESIPKDARKGFFIGLDGRKVPIPGDTQRDREHLCMSGYLQNGEKIIVARASIIIDNTLSEDKRLKKWFFTDIVHDELISEVLKDDALALRVAQIKAEAIAEAGRIYKLKCPMAGSYFNDETQKNTIGKTWYETH